ncbi:MAG: T9SS C-terminal target domain-containing protein [Bacteroidetes bacterium]|nr:MAG: T9SS C-terminal target domain-containing protein [Bacteroidota bacterium]
MKNTVFFLLLFVFMNLSYAQDIRPCYFDQFINEDSLEEAERQIQEGINKFQSDQRNTDSAKVIPVVVHVIHNGGSENISEAQIQSQIQILNEDFGKFENTNGDGNGVDTNVRFFLANLNPDGKCTNGIVRVRSSLTNHQSYQRPLLKELSFWDNSRYLNIYIVKSINGNVAGYASFPGGPPDEDGVVVQHNYFGNIGSANGFFGRTLTHEVGHWLGVYHTFNNSCGIDVCYDGDNVCDTPPAFEPNYSCVTLNTCSNDIPDLNDQKENYMDYTPGACKNMFTEGQKMRMQSTLNFIRTEIWTDENLINTGYDSIYITPDICPVIADFVTLTKDVCIGNSVNFSDISLNDGTIWQWQFPGGTPSSSNEQNPLVNYESIGSYDVILIISNTITTDTLIKENYINVSAPGVGDNLPYNENFDSGLYPPIDISINNPDGTITWQLDSLAFTSSNYSMSINNLENTNYGTVDEIVLPKLDFSSNTGNLLFMSFKWAYARSDPSYSDELLVLLSFNCGNSYTQVFYRSGSGLVTGPTQTTPFIPDSTQWKDAFIILNNFKTESFVEVKIVNVTDGGNKLYIDDLYIGNGDDLVAMENVFTDNLRYAIYPNPVLDQLNLELILEESQMISTKLINALGKVVVNNYPQNFVTGKHLITFSTSKLPQGLYFLILETEGNYNIRKVVVQH